MSERPEGPPVKTSPDDPPAANQPSEQTKGEVVGGPEEPEVRDARGREANDPSMSQAGVHEHPQAPPGKPDGEVDTRP